MVEPEGSGIDAARRDSSVNRRRLLQGAAGLAAVSAAPALRRPAPASAQAEVTLVYKTHDHPPAVELNNTLIAEFQEQNPGITIEYEALPFPDYEQALFTSFAGGDGWDVFWAGDWLTPQFFDNDILAPVDPAAYGVASTDEFLAMFDPGSLDAYIKDGNVYTGGTSEYNTFSLLYNPDHFAAAGIEALSETEPATWEQIAEYAKQLAQVGADGVRTRNGFIWAFQSNVWTPLITEPMVRQAGGELIDPESGDLLFTSPEAVKAFDYVRQLGEDGSIDPAFYVDLIEDYAQDRASMMVAGVWAIPAIRSLNPEAKIAVAPLPVFEGGERVTTLYSWAWFVGNQSSPEEQAAAWKFLAYITAQGQRWWDDCGYIQARNVGQEGVEDIAAYRTETEPLLAVFTDDFTYGRYMFRSPRFYEIATELQRVQSLVLEGEDAEQALQDAQDELEI
jgi:ABC-type glycerol-3-phosphate transport system substrate-binding protein